MIDGNLIGHLELLTSYILYKHGCTALPIDLERLAAKLGVTQICYAPLAGEGCVERKGQDLIITVRESAPFTRKRFSLAHELGHIILHRLEGAQHTLHYRDFRNYARVATDCDEEALVDQIAGLILLPSPLLISRLKGSTSIHRISAIASEAQVSLSTALIRAVSVATLPCAAAMLRKSSGGTPTVKWFRHSRAVDRAKFLSDIKMTGVTTALATAKMNSLPDTQLKWGDLQKTSRMFQDIETIYCFIEFDRHCGHR